MSEFWRQFAGRHRDAGVREALGAVYALAEQGEKTGELRFYKEILAVIQDELLPKVKEGPPILSPVAYGTCEDKKCRGGGEERGLFLIGGDRICVGCRKRRYAELRTQGVDRYWEHDSVKAG